ncbi:MAG: thiamine diphosphokinase [Ignavibacteriae bacterium]|nr:thiamine diphosphokinase [Ignavibacteriota bacterium]
MDRFHQHTDLHNSSNNNFDVLLCLDGNLPLLKDFFDFFKNSPVIAADGAAHKLQQMNVSPTFIIGDLDSFHQHGDASDFPDSTILHFPDQESNDFEKCLVFCKKQGYSSILVCGFHGGLTEHSLNNWSVLMRHSQILSICLYENGRYAIPLRESISFSAQIGETISLIPQPKAILTTSGLQWNLRNELLELGVREGARNCAVDSNISVEIHDGEVLLFCDSHLPFKPVMLSSHSSLSSII